MIPLIATSTAKLFEHVEQDSSSAGQHIDTDVSERALPDVSANWHDEAGECNAMFATFAEGQAIAGNFDTGIAAGTFIHRVSVESVHANEPSANWSIEARDAAARNTQVQRGVLSTGQL